MGYIAQVKVKVLIFLVFLHYCGTELDFHIYFLPAVHPAPSALRLSNTFTLSFCSSIFGIDHRSLDILSAKFAQRTLQHRDRKTGQISIIAWRIQPAGSQLYILVRTDGSRHFFVSLIELFHDAWSMYCVMCTCVDHNMPIYYIRGFIWFSSTYIHYNILRRRDIRRDGPFCSPIGTYYLK